MQGSSGRQRDGSTVVTECAADAQNQGIQTEEHDLGLSTRRRDGSTLK